MRLFFLIFFVGIPSFADPVCSGLFETNREIKYEEPAQPQFPSGHNTALRKIMQQMQTYEQEMQEFARAIRDPSARTQENLSLAMEMVSKYRKIFDHVIEHADQRLMTPRIDSIEDVKKAEYAQMYRELYVNYAKFIDRFSSELKRLSQLPAEEWTNDTLEEILREMNSAQPEAHRRS